MLHERRRGLLGATHDAPSPGDTLDGIPDLQRVPGPGVLLEGVLLALSMGVVGGIFPAVRAVRLNVLQALRDV